jgi:hypothetical protein
MDYLGATTAIATVISISAVAAQTPSARPVELPWSTS